MTNIASVVAMRGLPRRLSGRGTTLHARATIRTPPPEDSASGAGLIRWAPSGDLPAA